VALAKRVGRCVTPAPPIDQLAHTARRVFAGTVLDVEHTKVGPVATIAVDAVWKGSASSKASITHCSLLIRTPDTKLIVVEGGAVVTKSGCDVCFGVYADTPANRAALDKLLGTPSKP
jgi:hypothetical protein